MVVAGVCLKSNQTRPVKFHSQIPQSNRSAPILQCIVAEAAEDVGVCVGHERDLLEGLGQGPSLEGEIRRVGLLTDVAVQFT